MNSYITLKRAIVDAPFAAVHAIGTACSRFAPPRLFTSVNPAQVGILLALLVIASTCCWIPVASAQSPAVNIPDPILAAAVDTRLRQLRIINAGDTITQAHMSDTRFGSLIIYNPNSPAAQIENLTGLQYAGNLETLEIWNHDISSLEPIKDLTDLAVLRLTGSENLGDISHLQGLTNLKRLFLGNTGISNLAPLANLTKLTFLDLKNNEIQDISALANLTELTSLNLWNKDTLNQVRLSGNNQVRDIGPLANLTKLTHLYLDGNQISDISPLANLTKLRNLELQSNQVRDISQLPLDRMGALRSLILSDNQIRDISPLARAPLESTQLCLDLHAPPKPPSQRNTAFRGY